MHQESIVDQNEDNEGEAKSLDTRKSDRLNEDEKNFIGGPSCWFVLFQHLCIRKNYASFILSKPPKLFVLLQAYQNNRIHVLICSK